MKTPTTAESAVEELIVPATAPIIYPIMMRHRNGFIVLFSGPSTGTCLTDQKATDPPWPSLGKYSEHWSFPNDPEEWFDFHGAVRLRNAPI